MKVELLYFDGCPGSERFLPRLRELVQLAGVGAELELRHVDSVEAAVRERFLGSPTVRVDGVDVEPDVEGRSDFGLKCRLYATPDGLRGAPPVEWVTQALEQSTRRAEDGDGNLA